MNDIYYTLTGCLILLVVSLIMMIPIALVVLVATKLAGGW